MNFAQLYARTLKSLEWERLKAYLSFEAPCPCSRELCLALEPQANKIIITEALAQTAEAQALFADNIDLAQNKLPDLRDHLSRLGTGAVLGQFEILDLKRTLEISRRQKTVLNTIEAEKYPNLHVFLPKLHVLTELEQVIGKVIDQSGTINDGASPALAKLRQDMRRLAGKIKEELQKIINSPTLSKSLQEPIYTQRNGRYVLPVNTSHRQSIEGIVHDSSASGLTIYIEPIAVVELTNRIRLIEVEIEREIERLLLELSNQCRSRLPQIEESFQSLIEINFIWARGLLSKKYGGTTVKISESGKLKLLQARHPLLILQNNSINSVVPNDIMLGEDLQTLVITGPNTGGKTVLLKTAGILALMLKAGLLLPVAANSEAVIFSKVLADIGDEQSLEQNLSTFSAHMSAIVEIVLNAAQDSLVLLDEIGAGTDPREGQILARVILTRLKNAGALTICSTHFGDLKTLAHQESGFMNASMDFDQATLAPTYHIKLGVPGSSRAIAIASRLGLPEALVAEAEELLSSEKQDFEIKIEELEAKLSGLLERERFLDNKESELNILASDLKQKNDQLEEQIDKFKRNAANSLSEELRLAKKNVAELTAQLQKEPTLAKAQETRQKLDQLKEELGWLKPEESSESAVNWQKGQSVRIKSLNRTGIIDEIHRSAASGKQATVAAGSMKIKVSLADLELFNAPKIKSGLKQQPKAPNRRVLHEAEDPCFVRSERNTLDIRGKRVDEALAELEQFVDQSYRLQLSPVMIIHGHGTGALKTSVRDYLQASGYQAKFRPGETFEGGDGVTVVQFN
ncbi:MAG: endonuclease MutS2 [Candidatus Obscuribacterales bacterium]|nr:endonuclease MutS2 [Candidatus Obscuribacterales bacterium]